MSALTYDPRRRLLMSAGGAWLLTLAFPKWSKAADEIDIVMSGTPTGSHVWFRPQGLLIQPGQSVRWVNADLGNVHTVTAYHPDNAKPLRIPSGAASWNSGYLMPGESFSLTFTVPGVYDYFCVPHELAGMVGRIVVGSTALELPYAGTDSALPQGVLSAFPKVDLILKNHIVNE